MPRFRNVEDSSDVIETPRYIDMKAGKKDNRRIIKQMGKTYKRIPKPKPKSRATRCSEAVGGVNATVSELETVESSMEELEGEKSGLEEDLEGLDKDDDDFDERKDEISTRLTEIETEYSDLRSDIQTHFDSIDWSEIECLKDEIGEWRENLESNCMEHLPKYDEVQECHDELEAGYDNAEGLCIDSESADASEVRELINEIESITSDLECVNFPGMY